MPFPANCVCSGPSPSSTCPSMTESKFRIGTPYGSVPEKSSFAIACWIFSNE